jgi:hypothetical protein
VLPGPRVFDLVAAAVLLSLRAWLAATRRKRTTIVGRHARIPPPVLVLVAAVVGCVDGIDGIDGIDGMAAGRSSRRS